MKHNLLIFCSVFSIIFFSCCHEVGPDINLNGNGGGTDTTGNVDSSQQKNVLMEEFTGASCSNCPKGRDIIDNLVAQHPGRIVVVEVHEGALSQKVFSTDPDLTTPDGWALDPFLGPVPFWPSGAIDRRLYETSPGVFERVLDRNTWSTYIPQELDSTLQVKLGVNTTYDASSHMLTGSVTINFFQTVSQQLKITILITENGIIAGQVDGLTIDTNYIHEDVLRDIITNTQGDLLSGNQTGGSSLTYNLTPYAVSTEWNADSCHIIAFVSKAVELDVLQAMSKSLK